jgi:phosphatidylglycerophosphate synthase
MEPKPSSSSAKSFTAPIRIQENFLARAERALLDRLCDLLPPAVLPDHLTALGLFGAFLALCGFCLSHFGAGWLFLASFGLVVNWFGDSLDGSLARRRRIERPKYGYFLDHSVDAFGNFLLVAGLGATPYIDMRVALLALVGYLLLSIYAFLTNHVSGLLPLTFMRFGPTEMRVLLVLQNTLIFFLGPVELALWGHRVSLYTLVVGFFALNFFALFVISSLRMAIKLRGQALAEEAARAPAPPSA